MKKTAGLGIDGDDGGDLIWKVVSIYGSDPGIKGRFPDFIKEDTSCSYLRFLCVIVFVFPPCYKSLKICQLTVFWCTSFSSC